MPMKRATGSLRWILLRTYLLFVLAPLIGLGGFLVWLSFATQSRAALENQQHHIAHASAHIADFFLELTDRLQTAVALQEAQPMDRTLRILITTTDSQGFKSFDALCFLDNEGQPAAWISRTQTEPQMRSAERILRDLIRAASGTDQPRFSEILLDPRTGEPHLYLAVPRMDRRRGRAAGYLVAGIHFKRVWELLDDLSRENDADIYLLSGSGRIFAHRDLSPVLQERFFALPPADGITRGHRRTLVVLARAPLQIHGLALTVVAEAPLLPAQALTLRTAGIVGLLILLSLLAGWLLMMQVMRRIIRPVEELTVIARAIGSESPWFPAESVSDNELGIMADAFKRMTLRLRSTIETLSRSEAKYRVLLENLPQRIFQKDADSRYVACNANFARDLQIEPEQIEGKTDYDLFPPEQADSHRRDDAWVMANRLGKTAEEMRLLEGREAWASVIRVPLIASESGQVSGVIGILWDITERKQYESRLLQATQDAEAAQEAAEEANRVKSDFLANISHELRTPMHGILSYSRFGLEKAAKVSPEKVQHYFAQIQAGGTRLMHLLNDLLDLSKMEAGRMGYRLEEGDFAAVVSAVSAEFQPLLQAKGLSLRVVEPGFPLQALFDQARMMQVMGNLVENAIKFSPSGTSISISFTRATLQRAEGPPVPALQVAVVDQGVGIPPAEREAVFDQFTQSSATDSGSGGTGLGLAICREIVRAHGGTIWAEAGPDGRGSRLVFILPAAGST